MGSLELHFEEEGHMEGELHTKKQEQHETIEEKAVKLSQLLEESKDKEFIKSKLPELFSMLENELNLEILKGPEGASKAYREFQDQKGLVRVERFTKILETIELGKEFTVGESENESHFANAVIPEPYGIKIAWAEGQASGYIKIAFGLGLGKSLIGFRGDSENFEVSDIDYSETDTRGDVEQRRAVCRHIRGKIEKKDVIGVVMRLPVSVVPEEIMTETELENKKTSLFVFRSFLLNQ